MVIRAWLQDWGEISYFAESQISKIIFSQLLLADPLLFQTKVLLLKNTQTDINQKLPNAIPSFFRVHPLVSFLPPTLLFVLW